MASFSSPAHKKFSLFTYPGSSNFRDVPTEEIWALCFIVKDNFWDAVDGL